MFNQGSGRRAERSCRRCLGSSARSVAIGLGKLPAQRCGSRAAGHALDTACCELSPSHRSGLPDTTPCHTPPGLPTTRTGHRPERTRVLGRSQAASAGGRRSSQAGNPGTEPGARHRSCGWRLRSGWRLRLYFEDPLLQRSHRSRHNGVPQPGRMGGAWRTCRHVCGSRLVNGCVPRGGVDDVLSLTNCCSDASVNNSFRCLNPEDAFTTWKTCVQNACVTALNAPRIKKFP